MPRRLVDQPAECGNLIGFSYRRKFRIGFRPWSYGGNDHHRRHQDRCARPSDERKARRQASNARKGYMRLSVDAIEVDDRAIRNIGIKDVLQAVTAGSLTTDGNVRGFVRKWYASRN